MLILDRPLNSSTVVQSLDDDCHKLRIDVLRGCNGTLRLLIVRLTRNKITSLSSVYLRLEDCAEIQFTDCAINIMLCQFKCGSARLGFTAPKHIQIIRQELITNDNGM